MQYDVVIVGGGIAGAALARGLAEAGKAVLVLERERTFRDRVRGEEMHCWGVAEARRLGILDCLRAAGAHEMRYWVLRVHGAPHSPVRDLVETSPHRCGTLNFYHPEIQTAMLRAAAETGATVRRGESVARVIPGAAPAVHVRENGREQVFTARLVVGADGRDSGCRTWAGFGVNRDPDGMSIAGVLVDGVAAPPDMGALYVNPQLGQVAFAFPQGGGRFRVYLSRFGRDRQPTMNGHRAWPAFATASEAAGAPAGWHAGTTLAGPLACFDGADRWVEHPHRGGVALIGDAAASNDPTFGCGLSLALRDARVLRDQLLAHEDWTAAADAYAIEHDRYYGAIHRLTTWVRTVLYDQSPELATVRARAQARLATDPAARPDFVGLGPEFPSDDAARRRIFGED